MREIVVISGKGGTGKTSLSASFAHLEGENALITDCDVDAANMHLLLNADFASQEDFYSGECAKIDMRKCAGCMQCQAACHFDAIHLDAGALHVDPIECEGCHYCFHVCKHDAIEMVEQKSGDLFVSHINTGATLVHAKLGFAAENSGKLVAKVKNIAKQKALKENKAFVITDGSPGIGCPVISSLSGANLVVLVTEASESGLHDLKRIVKVLQTFGLKSVAIINKADLSTKATMKIKHFLHENSIDLVGTYLYDAIFSKALAEAKPITQYDPESSLAKQISMSWDKIKEHIA